MKYIEKCFYEVYVNKDTKYHSDIDRHIDYNDFTYIQKFEKKEEAVIFVLNLITVENLKDFTWECIDDNKVAIIDSSKNVVKVFIEICYEIIDERLVNNDLTSVYGCLIRLINQQIKED